MDIASIDCGFVFAVVCAGPPVAWNGVGYAPVAIASAGFGAIVGVSPVKSVCSSLEKVSETTSW
ncbi:hypothetical protein [Methylocapsa sp. S129]|uniref:hypothetical protein n=1 Tax=Methylocapsa sp. S129 TaxID=1641869 RepID=UPI00131E64F4|nr:hypothetical protein [Methylocapsa sp. S129]